MKLNDGTTLMVITRGEMKGRVGTIDRSRIEAGGTVEVTVSSGSLMKAPADMRPFTLADLVLLP